MSTPATYVTEHDLKHLQSLIDESTWNGDGRRLELERLAETLRRQKLLPSHAVPPDVITLNSQVQLLELDTGDSLTCTLVWPQDADIAQFKISVLSPVGMAMLGRRVGDRFDSPVPGGTQRLQVAAIWYQPEAVGDYS